MFPVTLESKSGDLLTVWPPCYGFMQQENYSGGDYDEDCDYDSPNTYDVSAGWNLKLNMGSRSNIVSHGRCVEAVLEDQMSMMGIAYIWNSGTKYPMLGVDHLTGELNGLQQYDIMNAETGDPCPVSNVTLWARSNNRPDVTERSVLEALEAFIDVGRPSCMVWHQDGFMGVDTSCNADRCLLYLMVDRAFYTDHEKHQIYTFLDKHFKEGMTILQALAFSRIFSVSENVFGEKSPSAVGNDYDSCIFPVSLYTVGIGADMAEPRATPWRQGPYTDGDGHLRDDDYSNLTYSGADLAVNNSMFLPVMLPNQSTNDLEIKADSLLLRFVEGISADEETKKNLVFGRWNNRPNTHTMISHLYSSNLGENENYNVIPKSEWEQLITDLFFGK